MAGDVRTPDGYVRIALAELGQLEIRHLMSAVDPTIALPAGLADASADVITGYSEWVGNWRGARVTLGWDWVLDGGEIRLLNAAEIRTNIRLTGEGGTVFSPQATQDRLNDYLKLRPWQLVVINEIQAGRARDPHNA